MAEPVVFFYYIILYLQNQGLYYHAAVYRLNKGLSAFSG